MSSFPSVDNDSINQKNMRMFHEKLAMLNDNFIRFVQNAFAKQPTADFTPTLQDYLEHLRALDEMYSVGTSGSTSSAKLPTTTSTTANAPILSFGASNLSAKSPITSTTAIAPTISFGTSGLASSPKLPNSTSSTTAPISFGTSGLASSPKLPNSTSSTTAPILFGTSEGFSLFNQKRKRGPPDENGGKRTNGPSAKLPTTTSTTAIAPIFSFGTSDLLPKSPITSTTSTTAPTFSFGTSGSTSSAKPLTNLFGTFASSSAAPTTNGGGPHNSAPDEDEGNEKPEEFVPKDDNIKPLVPLPPQVLDTKSGEEDEEVLLETRCKLFRYDSALKENKDRGIGELKILRNKETGRSRCLVRSMEGKLTANFNIIAGLNPETHKKPVVITWSCRDFSEKQQEGTDEIFLAKFRDEETAQQFKAKIEDLVKSFEEKK